MTLLTCEASCTLVQFARTHNVHQSDLWLPLEAMLPPRSTTRTCLTVEARTPVALLEVATNSLSLDKRGICVRLQVANALQCEETAVVLDPSLQPAGCVAFVRWDRKGTKHLQPGIQLLHCEVEAAAAPSLPSHSNSVTGHKRSREDGGDGGAGDATVRSTSNSVDVSTLADSMRGTQHRLSLQQRSTEDLQQRLAAALQSRGSMPHPRSLHILASTLANIRRRSAQPPLHFVLPATAESVEAGGVVWARTNRRILSRVFRGAASEERSTASRYGDGSRRVRFYFIEDVLLRRPQRWAVGGTPPTDAAAEVADDKATEPAAADRVELLLKDGVLRDMLEHAERGYRIVFFEHYPVLHHGSRHTLEWTLGPVVRLCNACCPHLTVTVVLSAMSYVTAQRRQGMDLSFVLPQAGLFRFFVTEMNTSLQPDPQAASLVGSGARGCDFLGPLHREFARNAALTYVDVADLK